MMRSKWWIAGGLGVALLATAIGIVFATYSLVRGDGFSLHLGAGPNYSAQGEETQRFTVDGPGELVVRSAAGDITVTAGAGNEVVVTAKKTAWGASNDEAKRELAGLNVSMQQEGGRITVAFDPEEQGLVFGRVRMNTVHLAIEVPAQMLVTANTGSGDIRLSGTTRGADLQTSYGAVDVSKISGALSVITNSGQVRINGVEAPEGAVSLTSRYGQITLEQGTIASLNVDSGSGEVTLTGLQIAGPVVVRNLYGAVSLQKVLAASYDLGTNSGAITVDSARGPFKARSGYGDITLSGAEGANLDLETASGQIRFSGSLGRGPHTINSNYGAISLAVPQGTALSCELATNYGQVKSDLPITISGTLDRGHWSGPINGGGASLKATTKSGDISLEVLKP